MEDGLLVGILKLMSGVMSLMLAGILLKESIYNILVVILLIVLGISLIIGNEEGEKN